MGRVRESRRKSEWHATDIDIEKLVRHGVEDTIIMERLRVDRKRIKAIRAKMEHPNVVK